VGIKIFEDHNASTAQNSEHILSITDSHNLHFSLNGGKHDNGHGPLTTDTTTSTSVWMVK
jgi:hypothetical protein